MLKDRPLIKEFRPTPGVGLSEITFPYSVLSRIAKYVLICKYLSRSK
jgi:hypothetical protein